MSIPAADEACLVEQLDLAFFSWTPFFTGYGLHEELLYNLCLLRSVERKQETHIVHERQPEDLASSLEWYPRDMDSCLVDCRYHLQRSAEQVIERLM